MSSGGSCLGGDCQEGYNQGPIWSSSILYPSSIDVLRPSAASSRQVNTPRTISSGTTLMVVARCQKGLDWKIRKARSKSSW